MWQAGQRTFYFAEFNLAANQALLFRCEKLVPLEPQACRVLLYLVENHQRLVSKNELLENVWRDVFTTDDVLKKAVSQIRRALGDEVDNPRFVQTLHRRGYRFIAEVSETSAGGELPSADFESAKECEKPKSVQPILSVGESDPDFDRLVGRAIEMESLQAEFRRALRGQGQPVVITGDPGAGKTQLANRFEKWATEQGAVCLRARFFDYEAARFSSYDLFLDLLKEALAKLSKENSIAENSAPASGGAIRSGDLRRTVEEQLEIALPDELFILTKAGSERLNAQSDAFRVIAPLAECFIRFSEKRPLVLIFDDLQWADDASLKLIGYLMRTAARAPLMLIALARGAEVETPSHPIFAWLQTQAVYRSYTGFCLAPLTLIEYRRFIGEIFRDKLDESDPPANDLRQLHQTTGGNPYFLVETLRMLIAENAVEKMVTSQPDAPFFWRWNSLRDVPLPETMRMAARSKLARLSLPTRDYIERAAVLGDAFHLETLERMYDGDGKSESELEECLREAVAAQVLTEQAVSGTDDCQFYHTVLRRAVDGDLSPRRRKRLHTRAAAAIETIYGDGLERVAAALGAHYEAAGNNRLSFERNLTACEAASVRFDWTEAADLLTRAQKAAKLLDAAAAEGDVAAHITSADRLRLLLAAGEVLMSIGKRIVAEAELSAAVVLAEETNDRAGLAAALGLKAHTLVLLGRYRESLAASRKALKLSRAAGNQRGVANALLQIASAQYALCEYDEACQVLQSVIEEFGAASYYAAVAIGKLGWVRALQSRYAEAKLLLERSLAFHQGAGDVRQRVVLALCLDWAEYGAGNYEAAINFALRARDEAHNIGESYSEAIALMRIGKSRLAQGLCEEGEVALKSVLAKLAGKNAVHSEAETIWLLGRANILRGNFAEAARLLERALETIREIGDREDEFRILTDRAALETRTGFAARSFATAQLAAQIAEEIGIPDGIGAALIEQAVALLALDQPIQAYEAATSAAEKLEAAGSGIRWYAYQILAATIGVLPPDFNDFKSEMTTPEVALRRSLKLLEETGKQFAEVDFARRQAFIRAHREPARVLSALLLTTTNTAANRSSEAVDISRAWQLDQV